MSSVRQRSPSLWALFLAGPVISFTHFMAVYLLAEATCAVGGPGPDVLGLSLLSLVTLAATAVAIAAIAVLAVLAYRRWRASTDGDRAEDWIEVTDRNPGLAFAGFVLGLVFIAATAFVGVPAAFLEPC